MLPKIRAALVTAVMWSAVWALWGSLVAGVGYALNLQQPMPFRKLTFGYLVARSAFVGFAAGAVFSGLLALVYRRRQAGASPPARVALWGILAVTLLPVAGGVVTIEAAGVEMNLAGAIGSAVVLYIVPGLLTAWATVKVAQAGLAPPRAGAARAGETH